MELISAAVCIRMRLVARCPFTDAMGCSMDSWAAFGCPCMHAGSLAYSRARSLVIGASLPGAALPGAAAAVAAAGKGPSHT